MQQTKGMTKDPAHAVGEEGVRARLADGVRQRLRVMEAQWVTRYM
nr:hypothetical protein GCM10017611_76640 [Rhodococcus wratislaviensis]